MAAISKKRIQIDKANIQMIVVVSMAVFVTVFSLVASNALLSRRAYQAKVIKQKEIARTALAQDLQASTALVNSYQAFVSGPTNVIGGNTSGGGDQDGDNAKIILDALPSKYDFPALATSLNKIFTNHGFAMQGIGGTDDELAQGSVAASPNPQPVTIPFSVSLTTNYSRLADLFGVFERSIRPMQIQSVSMSGRDDQLSVSVTANTYYQPEKSFSITKAVVQ